MENNADNRRWWECNICHTRYISTATTSAIEHLRIKHFIKVNSELRTSSLSSVLAQQQLGAEIQELQNMSLASNLTFQDRLVTVCHASFGMITNEYFRSLFLDSTALQNNTLCHIPTSHNTLRVWIENDFDKAQNKIKILLRNSRGKVHLSFDLWTSPNGLVLNGVVSHFIDAEYNI